MRRRDLLKLAACGAVAPALQRLAPAAAQPRLGSESEAGSEARSEPGSVPAAVPEAVPGSVIDAHIHLFDPLRPGGVPWPDKTDTALYKPALPDRYTAEAARFGSVGAVAIECSPLKSDNQWLLNVAADHPVIVGVVGDLVPNAPDYLDDLDRLHQNPLFLGIRYGNLWNRDLAADLDKPGFLDGLKALAAAGLVFESANPDPRLIGAIRGISEQIPDLRIVIDHLPQAAVPTEQAARDAYWADLRTLAQNPRVFVKLSEIPVRVNGRLETDPHFYRAPLDAICELFGEDRIVFGSDWPNSDHVASYAQTFAIVRGYMARKTPAAQEKYFWKNSIAAYRWKQRRTDQPTV